MPRIAGLLILGLLAGCASSSCQLVEFADLPVSFTQSGEPVIAVTINGHRLRMLVDTGAESSFITPEAKTLIGASSIYGSMRLANGVNGSFDTDSAGVRNFPLGGIRVENEPFAVGAIFQPGARGGIDGLIGEDILGHYNIALDFPHGRLGLYSADGCAGGFPFDGAFARLPFTLARDHAPEIAFYLDGRALHGVLDTGASRWRVEARALADAGIAPERVLRPRRSAALGGLTGEVEPAEFATLTIGAEMFSHPWLAIGSTPDPPTDALIGESYLRDHEVYISNQTQTVWLSARVPAAN